MSCCLETAPPSTTTGTDLRLWAIAVHIFLRQLQHLLSIEHQLQHRALFEMASVDELKNVLKETLEQRGLLGQVRAQVRAAVFSALDEQNVPRPSLPNSNLLINELIREYLEHNQYKYTASVLLAEAGQPETPLGREFLTQELNISTDEKMEDVPLLYGMLSHFLQHGEISQEKIPARLHPDRQCSSSGLSHKVPH